MSAAQAANAPDAPLTEVPPVGLSDAELRTRLAPLVTRGWTIDDLILLYRYRADGRSRLKIAARLGASVASVDHVLRRLFEATEIDQRYGDWPPQRIATLRRLWAEGHSSAEIGRRMGTTKNAIVGKAHRLDLPTRPSPIREGAEPPAPRAPRVKGPTLPPLASAVLEEPTPVAAPAPKRLVPVALNRPLKPAPKPRAVERTPVAAAPLPKYGRVTDCCWPIGEPGTRTFRFCDTPSDPGRPYCGEHAKLAYVKIQHSVTTELRR